MTTGRPEGRPEHQRDQLVVLQVVDSLAGGGAERSTVSLLPHLMDRGITPVLATLHDRPGLQEAVAAAGVRLVDVSGDDGRLGWVRRLEHTIAEIQPDLVHTCLYESDIAGRIAARRQRVPVLTASPRGGAP